MKSFFCIILSLCLLRVYASWSHTFSLETGYRPDNIFFEGPMQSANVSRYEKKVHLDLWQINLKDRVTWNRILFLNILGGYGHAFSGNEKAFITTPVYVATPPLFNVAAPYNNMGAASVVFTPGAVSVPQEIGSSTVLAYQGSTHGHAWSFDVNLGASFMKKVLSFQGALEPRIGYTSEWLFGRDSFDTHLQGGYFGIGVPLSWRCLWVNPEVAYVFAGCRHEKIGIHDLSTSSTNFFSFKHGKVRGFKAALELDYPLSPCILLGFQWRYFHLHTHHGRFASLQNLIFWDAETRWSSNQFLGKISYVF